MAKYLLLDGFNLIFRAFYGIPELTRKDGLPTNAIHGVVRTVWYLEDNEKADYMYMFFDLGGAQKRLELREDYKAHRSATPEALTQQIPYIKQLARLLGYGCHELEGVEADDLIGAAVKKLSSEGHQVKIVSSDKDLAQCMIYGNVSQLLPPPTANPRLGWRELKAENVVDKFGVSPEKIPEYLALVGDTSDNIPGLQGVGPKTAAKWLNQFGSLEAIIAHCGEIKPVRFQSIVHKQQDEIRKNLKMTTLDYAAAIDLESTAARDASALIGFFEEMEMNKAKEDAGKRYSV